MSSKNNSIDNNKFFDINDNNIGNNNNGNNSTMKTFTYSYNLFMIILGLIISFFILNWLIKIDKCNCADIPERYLLKEWFIFSIIYELIILIFLLINGSFENSTYLLYLSAFLGIIAFIMIVRLLIYIDKLKKINCNCGLSKQQDIIYYWYIIIFSLLLFFILTILLFEIVSYLNK
jgi:hypothetical protein